MIREVAERGLPRVGDVPLTAAPQGRDWEMRGPGRVHLKEEHMRSRFALGLSAVVVSLLVGGTGRAGDPVESGLKPGEFVSPFDVDDITGPNKGKTLCYR